MGSVYLEIPRSLRSVWFVIVVESGEEREEGRRGQERWEEWIG